MVDAAGSIVSIQRVEEILSTREEPSGSGDTPLDEETVLVFDNLTFGYSSDGRIA